MAPRGVAGLPARLACIRGVGGAEAGRIRAGGGRRGMGKGKRGIVSVWLVARCEESTIAGHGLGTFGRRQCQPMVDTMVSSLGARIGE